MKKRSAVESGSSRPYPRERDIARFLRSVALATTIGIVAGVLVQGLASGALSWPLSLRAAWATLDLPQIVFLCLALALLLVGLLSPKIPVRIALSLITSLVCLVCAMVICRLCAVDLTTRVLYLQQRYGGAAEMPSNAGRLYRFDDTLGYALIPNNRVAKREGGRKVVYTTDADGCRITPTPPAVRGTVLIVGCSFTLGLRVQDAETYPFILGSEYWPAYKVKNRSCGGWGTTQAYLNVARAMGSTDTPCLVIYATMENGHVQRNYLRKELFRMHRNRPKAGMRLPHFEISDGRLTYRGLAGEDEAIPDEAPGLGEKELAVTIALLKGMHRICEEHGVPFVVVELPAKSGIRLHHGITAALRREQIPLLDLGDRGLEAFLADAHPNPHDHKKIARAIAQSFVTGLLEKCKPGADTVR